MGPFLAIREIAAAETKLHKLRGLAAAAKWLCVSQSEITCMLSSSASPAICAHPKVSAFVRTRCLLAARLRGRSLILDGVTYSMVS